MCGLFGIIFPYEKTPKPVELLKARKVFSNLAVFSASRGTDATGIYVIDKQGGYSSYKGTSPSYEMVHDDDWWTTLDDIDGNIHMLMGHTRLATNGANIPENVHPFVFNKKDGSSILIGAHNGVIVNDRDYGDHENDSKNFLEHLFPKPLKEWPEALNDIWGSFALTIWRDGTIIMARNDESPLMLIDIPEMGGATVYASEEHIIRGALTTAKIPNKSIDVRYFPQDRMLFQTKEKKPVIKTLVSSWVSTPRATTPTSVYDPRSQELWNHEIEYDNYGQVDIASDTEFQMKCSNCELMLPSRFLTLVGDTYVCSNCHNTVPRKLLTTGVK